MNRSLLMLLVAFIVLVAIYMGVKSSRDVTYHPEMFTKIDTLRADLIRIRAKDQTILFKKNAGEWQMEQPLAYPVDTRLVRDFLSKLSAMEKETEEPLSQDPDRDTLFQVNSAGSQVTVAAGTDTMLNVILGKVADDYRHTYSRKVGDKNVYLVKGMFTSQLTRLVRDWRDKTILDVPLDSIDSMDLQWPGQPTLSLVSKDTLWTLEQGGKTQPADKQAADHLGSAFYKFRTMDFVDGDSAKKVDFSKPAFTITIHTAGGSRSFSLLPMPGDEKNQYLLKRDDLNSTLFVIYQGTANVFMKKAEDFKPGAFQAAMAKAGAPGSRSPQQPDPKVLKEMAKKYRMQQGLK